MFWTSNKRLEQVLKLVSCEPTVTRLDNFKRFLRQVFLRKLPKCLVTFGADLELQYLFQ